MKINRSRNFGSALLAVTAFCFLTSISVWAQKSEQISATAMGTSTQMGRIISIDLRIFEYSTADDQLALLEAFKSHGPEGLVNALDKMKSKGRIAITGTLGFDVNYIREFKMEDGTRKIRFVTDRPITFGEVWGARRSMDYMITVGEINIGKDKSKSTGMLMPAAKVQLDKEGELKIETYQNPWDLKNIKVWK